MSYTEALAEFNQSRTTEERQGTLFQYFAFQDSGSFETKSYIRIEARNSAIESYDLAIKRLFDFCEEHELDIYGYGFDRVVDGYSYGAYYNFYLTTRNPGRNTQYRTPFGTLLSVENKAICRNCEHENPMFVLQCEDCLVTLHCNYCNTTSQSHLFYNNDRNENLVFHSRVDEQSRNGCTNCCSVCDNPGCERVYRVSDTFDDGSDEYLCSTCDPRFVCNQCGGTQRGECDNENNLCTYCFQHRCDTCGFVSDEEMRQLEGERMCNSCFSSHEVNSEVFDDDSEMVATKLAIPTIEGRERIRFCGIEIEGVNGRRNAHNIIANDLFESGLSIFNEQRGYHDRYARSSFAHVERDSSCDWEVVAGPINMASINDVRNLNRIIKLIRGRIKDKTVKLGLNCGLHIHVSAERVGVKQAHNLHILYTYLEDVIYRLGAAKWPMHRAVTNGDRSYKICPRTITAIEFANTYTDNRYYGLSFSNYFQKMLNSCGCGAGRFGMFDECTCSLDKCTFEFRIFNTTANTKKIHAYMALTQALVAKALAMPAGDYHEEFPQMNFNLRNFKDMDSIQQQNMGEKWAERLKFIFEELPLTTEEKESLIYCVANSELEELTDFCFDMIKETVEVV